MRNVPIKAPHPRPLSPAYRGEGRRLGRGTTLRQHPQAPRIRPPLRLDSHFLRDRAPLLGRRLQAFRGRLLAAERLLDSFVQGGQVPCPAGNPHGEQPQAAPLGLFHQFGVLLRDYRLDARVDPGPRLLDLRCRGDGR